MRKLHIRSVRPGDRTAKPIFMEDGRVLLGVGIELSERYIERLMRLGIDAIYIEDQRTEGILPDELITDATRRNAVQTVYSTIYGLLDKPVMQDRASIPQLGDTFRNVFGDILNELVGRKDILVNLSNLNVMDGYLFHHSVNVAVLAGIIGISKGYNRSQLLDLGVGALLFDIGMTKLPKELLSKKGPLNEEERKLMHTHPQLGFDLLRKQPDISLLSAHCAFQHHERFDGHGYPRQLQGSQISEYAQIIAIADVYDALVSPRAYRRKYMPHEATEFLFGAGNQYFDLELVRLFLKHISIYPVSSTIMLNTGQVGVVSRVDPSAVHRPVVRIIQEPDGTPCRSPYEIDLKEQFNLIITKTL